VSAIVLTTGVGLIVIWKVIGLPVHTFPVIVFVYSGVTVIIPDRELAELFAPLKLIFPIPEVAKPMAELEFVQL
jgi:hypothetical protein